MITYEEFKSALKIVKEYQVELENHLKKVKNEASGVSLLVNDKSDISIFETSASVRLLNLVHSAFDELKSNDSWFDFKMKDLSKISLTKFSKQWYSGGKTKEELLELCKYYEVSMLP